MSNIWTGSVLPMIGERSSGSLTQGHIFWYKAGVLRKGVFTIAEEPLKDFEVPAKLGWAPSVRIRRKESLHCAIDTPESCIEVEFLTDRKV